VLAAQLDWNYHRHQGPASIVTVQYWMPGDPRFQGAGSARANRQPHGHPVAHSAWLFRRCLTFEMDGEMLTLDVSLRLSVTYKSIFNQFPSMSLVQSALNYLSVATVAAIILLKTVINVGLCNLRITASHIPKSSWLSSKNNAQTGYNYRHRSAHGRITTGFFLPS
jgi:hypothetical protein